MGGRIGGAQQGVSEEKMYGSYDFRSVERNFRGCLLLIITEGLSCEHFESFSSLARCVIREGFLFIICL